ncbi:MAG: type II methionyl aminopeptidase [Candidatus Nanohaloarchaea archaeon]|nr:type II methionyl aminopeptidase [Candidatus Nanohaloarchaea archaeon]
MDEEVKENYIEAGKIAKDARDAAEEMSEPGVKLADIAEETEKIITERGAKPAFPVNLSLNAEAAHYTPAKDTERELSEGDLLKIDVGAHVDGYIADTAVTVDLGNHGKLTKAVSSALKEAIDIAEAGENLGDIGETIQNEIESFGLKPVRNLGGHGLDQYVQHSGDRIPNIETSTSSVLEAGNAYAIEPFATDGAGKVVEGGEGHIYKYEGGNTRNRTARKVLKEIKRKYKTLPFASRWFDLSPGRLKLAFRNLTRSGVVHGYDILREEDRGMVSQKEHTILVLEDQVIVTTR